MNIVMLKTADLVPYENNPRDNADAVPYVMESIKQFGFKQPIVIDKDNIVIAGHTRLKAAKKLKLKEVPCIIADDLTEEQVKAYRLADNKVAEKAEWDFDLLADELADIFEIDMEALGFELDTYEEEPEAVEDDYEVEVPAEPKAKLGDIYQLGKHRLMCGDSTSITDVKKLMDGESADIVWTDPPYGMNLDTDYSSMKSAMFKGKTGGADYMPVKGDNEDFSAELINTIFTCFPDCKEVFLWGADYYAELLPDKNSGSWIVWDKRSANQDDIEQDESADKMFGSCFELCWSKNKHKREIARIKWAGLFGMESEFDKKRCHPTQKPTKLCDWFLKRYSKPGDNVVDLYGGSGCTLITCEQTGRNCFMMEYEPKYIDVIINRWENFTGEKAVLLNE